MGKAVSCTRPKTVSLNRPKAVNRPRNRRVQYELMSWHLPAAGAERSRRSSHLTPACDAISAG